MGAAAADPPPAGAVSPSADAGTPVAEAAARKDGRKAEYRRDLREAVRNANALAKLQPSAQRRWPETFAGLWLEHGKTFIAFTDKAKKRVKQLREKPGKKLPRKKRKGLRSAQFENSWLELRNLQAQMISDRGGNPVTITVPPPNPRFPAQIIPVVYDLDIDVKANVVVAIVEEAVTSQLAAAFAQRYGPDVVVRQGELARDESLYVCKGRTSCPPFLRSGMQTIGSVPCSTAFAVSYAGGKGILSASHCGNPDANVGQLQSHATGPYGAVLSEQNAGQVDAELHSVTHKLDPYTPWSTQPTIYATDADKKGRVLSVGNHDGLQVGQGVCKSGYVTDQTCGEVTSTSYAPAIGGTQFADFVKATYCSNPGDSGSGVYRKLIMLKPPGSNDPTGRYEALGIHKSGPAKTVIVNGKEEKEPRLCPDPNDYGIFGHIEYAEQALGVEVLKDSP